MIRIQIELIRGEGKVHVPSSKTVNITVNNKSVDVTIVNSQ